MANSISFSGTIPEVYDQYLGPLLFEPFAKDLTERIKNRKISSVLELACGTGRVTKYLSKLLPDAKIYATDINPDMLVVAKKKVTAENIEWKQTDMQEIPFEDSKFDLVVCQFGIMFVPDKPKAYKEIFRVLKTGAVLLFNTWESRDNNKLAFCTNEVVNGFFKDDPILFYKIPFSYFKEDEIRKDMNEAGFKDITFTFVNKEGVSQSVAEATKGLVEGNPVLTAINERNPELKEVIEKQLSETLSDRFGDNPMKCSMNAIVVETVK
ncbi:MAG: class I SAM-dependent methyltransferase [Ignavibacteria bacterium]|nr:class I SAM-dependent methyltransferase [Ignavibacteria bacterium]